MSLRKVTIEVPLELYEKFKVNCIQNHSTVKDEVTDMICAALENKPQSEAKSGKTPQKTVVINGKEVIDDLDDVVTEKEDLEAKLTPIWSMVKGLTSIAQSQKADLDTLKGRLESPQTCPRLEKFDAIEKNFIIVGKLIQSLGEAIIQDTGGKWCLDDIKGIRALGLEPSSFSMEHSKKY